MELGLIIVVILLLLAAFDLTVGVANDAVNFINSALGANAATLKKVLIVAALGVFVGVFFSGGMLEVARKGVFYPQQFQMMELLIIFLAVMFQEIFLLDIFNTYGLPTSTTVSIVFGLMGSALAMAVAKLASQGQSFDLIVNYINLGSILKIVTAIFLSIIIAFVAGAVIQYITRMIFTFDYEKRFKKYGGIWSGIVLAALTQFVLIKGAKHATFVPTEFYDLIKANFWMTNAILFVFWFIIVQLFLTFTKRNVLKGIVLFGTFSLALAFAANDLVNFIGAPIAGLNAYQIAVAAGNNPLVSMDAMNGKVAINTLLLFVAAGIMVVTLFMSKKALSVARTGIDLGRQDAGYEKFESNIIGRVIVKIAIDIFKGVIKFVPSNIREFVKGRFDEAKFVPEIDEDGREQSFDLIRATVILFVSATLITIATSMKLPLSTTYVTFIAAMAAALPDKAWGRESAAYRVSGVITVIGGWFFTAFAATIIAFLFSLFLYWAGAIGILILAIVVGLLIYKSNKIAKKRHEIEEEGALKFSANTEFVAAEPFPTIFIEIADFMQFTSKTLNKTLNGLATSNIDLLKKAYKASKKTDDKAKYLSYDILKIMETQFDSDNMDSNYIRSQAMVVFRNISEKTINITNSTLKYFENNHHEFEDEQIVEVKVLSAILEDFISTMADIIKNSNFETEQEIELKTKFKLVRKQIKDFTKQQIKRQQNEKKRVRRTMLYINTLFEIDRVCNDIMKIYSTSKKVYKQNQDKDNDV